jgi:biotin transport system substrate-specific component
MTTRSSHISWALEGGAPAALRRAVPLAIFVALTALAARVQIPLGPVPATLQPAAVLAAGLVLGAARGAASQALYVAVGLAGLPVFAHGGGPGYLLLPTAGFLLGFPLAAWVAGRLGHGRGLSRALLGATAGLAVIHVGGFAGLTLHGLATGAGADAPALALGAGLLPFLATDPLKIALAASVGVLWSRRAGRA